MLPSALLPAASKLGTKKRSKQVYDFQSLPDRSQCFGGHHVLKTATPTSPLINTDEAFQKVKYKQIEQPYLDKIYSR